jgi:hypothetical protein
MIEEIRKLLDKLQEATTHPARCREELDARTAARSSHKADSATLH